MPVREDEHQGLAAYGDKKGSERGPTSRAVEIELYVMTLVMLIFRAKAIEEKSQQEMVG